MKEEYNLFAEIYDYITDQDPRSFLKFLEKNLKGKTVLDLGCGTGTISNYLTHKGFSVIGIDSSEEMLEIAKAKVCGNFYKKGLENFSFNEEFDTIVSHDAINHLLDENALKKCFQNCYNSLKKDGLLLFNVLTNKYVNKMITSNGYGEFIGKNAFIWEDFQEEDFYIIELSVFKNLKNNKFLRNRIEIVQRIYSLQKLKELLNHTGFSKIKVVGTSKSIKNSNEWFFIVKK